MYGNPVPGRIQLGDEPWEGTPTFRVTSSFAEHVASGRGPGVDLGNGRCGDPVLAIEAGTISQVFQDPNGAIVVRIRHANGDTSGYAHLVAIETSVGIQVARGTAIGHVGATGASACHLHIGLNRGGAEIDLVPLLDQFILNDDMDASFVAVGNRTLNVNAGARHRLSPRIAADNIAIGADPGGPLAVNGVAQPILGTVQGEAVNGNAIWYVYWRQETKKLYYLHSSTATIAEFAPAGGGFTQKDLDDAVSAAVTPIQIQLEIAKRKITEARTALGG